MIFGSADGTREKSLYVRGPRFYPGLCTGEGYLFQRRMPFSPITSGMKFPSQEFILERIAISLPVSVQPHAAANNYYSLRPSFHPEVA